MLTPRSPLLLAGIAGAALAMTANPAVAAPTRILTGRLAAGGSWTLSGHHQSIGPSKGLCLNLDVVLADGSSPGTATGCAAGSLSAVHNVWTMSARSAGTALTSYEVAGIVTSRARVVQVTFANGKRKRVRAKTGPRGWRRALGTRVRYFGFDALPATTTTVKTVTAYDRHHRRVARSGEIH
jgi:hypothetical protein